MQIVTGQGGTVTVVGSEGRVVVENTRADWMREQGVEVSQGAQPAPVAQKRDELGRWM